MRKHDILSSYMKQSTMIVIKIFKFQLIQSKLVVIKTKGKILIKPNILKRENN